MKMDPLVSSLSLYDIRGAPGVAADISHIDFPGEVRLFLLIPLISMGCERTLGSIGRNKLTEQFRQVNGYPADKLEEALTGVDLVIIPAGVPRKVRLSFLDGG